MTNTTEVIADNVLAHAFILSGVIQLNSSYTPLSVSTINAYVIKMYVSGAFDSGLSCCSRGYISTLRGRDIIPEIQSNGIIYRKLLKNLDLSSIPATQKMSTEAITYQI